MPGTEPQCGPGLGAGTDVRTLTTVFVRGDTRVSGRTHAGRFFPLLRNCELYRLLIPLR